ncbi:MAG TPA: hypothetical protein VGZ71_02085, partial [Puia sp.]|nr:hypothetical protein [Puia sp.]
MAHKSAVKIPYVPFNKVVVFDNRFDTSKIYIFESGQYPLATLGFDQPAGDAIKNYIEKAIEPIQKGDKTLLVNIRELHIPNRGIYIRIRSVSRRLWHLWKARNYYKYYNSRDYLRFFSEIYMQTGETAYKKIADLRLFYFVRPTTYAIGSDIRSLLDELIGCASVPHENIQDSNITAKKKSYWARDSIAFDFSKDTSSYTMEMICIPAIERWNQMRMMSSTLSKDGVYDNFEDFKADKIAPVINIGLIYNGNDSLYRMNPGDSAIYIKSGMCWAVCVSGQLFIHLGGNIFQKLTKMNNTFGFNLPYSLPDIYTILSLNDKYRFRSGGFASTGNIFFDLAALSLKSALDAGTRESALKKIKRQSVKHNFRTCFIDMDSGDFVY